MGAYKQLITLVLENPVSRLVWAPDVKLSIQDTLYQASDVLRGNGRHDLAARLDDIRLGMRE